MTNTIKTKADVQTHGWEPYPALNVKVLAWGEFTPCDKLLRQAADENGYDPDKFVAWWTDRCKTETYPESPSWLDHLWQSACGEGYEQAVEQATEVFGSDALSRRWNERTKQYDTSTGVSLVGRQGGWLVVKTLPAVESWDAVMLARWRSYAKTVDSIVADIPYMAVQLVLLNTYETYLADQKQLAEMEAKWASLASLIPA